MDISHPDNDWNHLYPEYREKLKAVLAEVAKVTGEPWELVEGFRSQERQSWLYAQGRTRPGPIVTWKQTPTWHGTGLAADVRPAKSGYNAPRHFWESYRAIYEKHGLDNPAWQNGDLGHCQLSSMTVRAKALVWIKGGFK